MSILMIRENEILKEYNTQLFIFIFLKIFFFRKNIKKKWFY